MFSKIELSNFRSFRSTGDIPLTRFNILIGANSSGKSSLLYALLLLKQTLEDANLENFLVTDGRMVNLGSFDDLVFGHAPKEGIGISVAFDEQFTRDSYRRGALFDEDDANRPIPSQADLVFGCNRRNKQFFLSKFSIQSTIGDDFLSGGTFSNGRLASVQSGLFPNLKSNQIYFFHFLPLLTAKRHGSRSFDYYLYQRLLDQRLMWERAFRNLAYIGPVRNTIQVRYPVTGESPTGVGIRGENLLAVLFQDQKIPSRRRKYLLRKLNKWLEGHFGFVTDINLEALTKDRSVYALTGLDPQTGVRVNLSHVGFGVSQAAPIIVQGFLSPPNTCLLIEQPEIHLHPAAQADLADLFIDIMNEQKQLFVETHSEHMILRLRRRIAEGTVSARDIQLLFVSKGKEGSRIEPLKIETSGQIENWPKGFFEEGYVESLKIAEAVG